MGRSGAAEEQHSLATHTVAMCGCLYFVLATARYLMLRTSDLVLEIACFLSSTSVQFSMAVVAVIGSALYMYGEHLRNGHVTPRLAGLWAMQTLLKHATTGSDMVVNLVASSASSKPSSTASSPAKSHSGPSSSITSPGRGSAPGSPFKDISSFRLSDTSLKSSSRHHHSIPSPRSSSSSSRSSRSRRRFSLDVHGSASRVELTLKPRTSIDFDTQHVTTPKKNSSHTRYHGRRVHYGGRTKHSMPRIASGQELATQQGDCFLFTTAAAAPTPPAAAQAPLNSLSRTSSGTLSAVVNGRFEPGTPPNEPIIPTHNPFSFVSEEQAVLENSITGISMAAISSWTASAFSWQSIAERADSLLRPLVPSSSSVSFQPLESLKRWNSAPGSWRFKSGPWLGDGTTLHDSPTPGRVDDGEESLRSPRAGEEGRRGSLDGPTARHYTHGVVCAGTPETASALEQCASAAKSPAALAASSSSSYNGHGHGVEVQLPGHGLVHLQGDVSGSALASLGLDGDCPQAIRERVTDEHLLQFAAMAGDSVCQQLVDELGVAPPYGEESSLFGKPDEEAQGEEWELIIDQSRPGLRVQAWRLPLKKGLYLYRQAAIIEGVTPREARPFHIDDQAREIWDDGAMFIRRVLPPGVVRLSKHAESCLHKYTSRFPRPMAPREYNYGRRVWHRPGGDGGCYVICRAMELPQDAEAPRAVQVTEFISCTSIKAVQGGTELITCYFEDSHIRPGLAKMGVPKGLWPFWTKYADALRVFSQARKTAACLPHSRHHRRSLDGYNNNNTSSNNTLNSKASSIISLSRESCAAVLAKVGNVPTFITGTSSTPPTTTAGGAVLSHRPFNTTDVDEEESDSGSEDEVYDMLHELKHLQGGRGGGRSAAADSGLIKVSSARWARRLLIAGALRMLQMTLANQA